jgi:hypothetical protein
MGNAHAPGGVTHAVIGGFIYRGRALPGLTGRYVFGGWSSEHDRPSGRLFVANRPAETGRPWTWEELRVEGRPDGRPGEYVLSFGQDDALELYVLTSEEQGPRGSTGKVLRIVPPG